MIVQQVDAVLSLRPGARVVIVEDEIISYDHADPQPTSFEISVELQRLEAEQPWNELRAERNRRLAETDWEIVRHKELGTHVPVALKNYRQELRDLPENTSDPVEPVWPIKP